MKIKQKLALNYIRTKFRLLSMVSTRKTAEKSFELFCTPMIKFTKEIPAVFQTAEQLDFLMQGKRINGYRWNKGQKEKVLILHGFSSNAYKFHQYIQPLIKKGYEVLAFNAPAHGNSEGKTVNALEYSEMITQIIHKYGKINSFIAHSFGGIAVSLAIEKIKHDETTKIVLIAPATETVSAIDDAFKILRLKNDAIRAAFDDIILQKSGYPVPWFSIRRAMENIKASVLWIHDEEDDITPLSDALKVKEDNHPNIQFIITKGLGHRKIYRSLDVKNMIYNFL